MQRVDRVIALGWPSMTDVSVVAKLALPVGDGGERSMIAGAVYERLRVVSGSVDGRAGFNALCSMGVLLE